MFQHGSPSKIDGKAPEAPHTKNGVFIRSVRVTMLTDTTTEVMIYYVRLVKVLLQRYAINMGLRPGAVSQHVTVAHWTNIVY